MGATASKGKGGNIIVSNLKKGYSGKIYPVNPGYKEIEGLPCYPSVADVPDPVDLAIVFVAAHMVPGVIEDCAKRNIPGVMIQSAGFSETGTKGEALQQKAKQIADKTGIRLWGPNCMGLVDAGRRYVFSTVTPAIWETGLTCGNVSLIAQSGMLAGAFLIDLMSHGTMGISKVCSIGNKMDVDENDLLAYLIGDPDTAAIGLYLESFTDCRRFMALSRGTTKPIVILNGGKTAGGAAAAVSHTASLSASGALVSGAMAQAGIVEANDFYQLADYCKTLGMYPDIPPESRNRVAVLTYTGAAGIVSADIMDTHGLVLSQFSAATLEELQTVFPEWMPPSNPVDMWPGIILNGSKKVYGKAMEAVCADPGVDAVFVHCFAGGFSLETDLEMMAKTARKAGKPLFCWISGERERVHQFQETAQQHGIPVFREIMRAVECMGMLFHRPKGILPGIAHKTESNLVRLGIGSEQGLEKEVESLQQTLQGRGSILIQKQVQGKMELMAGFVKDPRLGPCVMCGLGGIFAEALNDTVFGLAPLTLTDALHMIDRLKCRDMLDGYRGCDPVDKSALGSILVTLGNLGCAYPDIQEIDINPLIIHKGVPVAVDGLVVLAQRMESK
ncbi:MAG: acetate--CoA ligase family protein [Desulfobacteraceae bacterium]|nr:acetate--CoA ligase family protein [Desulfobacteraceae bacterium]